MNIVVTENRKCDNSKKLNDTYSFFINVFVIIRDLWRIEKVEETLAHFSFSNRLSIL